MCFVPSGLRHMASTGYHYRLNGYHHLLGGVHRAGRRSAQRGVADTGRLPGGGRAPAARPVAAGRAPGPHNVRTAISDVASYGMHAAVDIATAAISAGSHLRRTVTRWGIASFRKTIHTSCLSPPTM